MEFRDGRLALDLEDPEGQRLTLVDDGGAGAAGELHGAHLAGLGAFVLAAGAGLVHGDGAGAQIHLRPAQRDLLGRDLADMPQVVFEHALLDDVHGYPHCVGL